uniref:Uncharacterized protein n=1 Tax=Candidatus Kentrum sp. FM TaxID=2126340 RepID=A0A450TIX5_9GAMM|nr:MAG: hypothetical protein BECKFM1743A_GA0114220_104421 [Candidatus Kentron sp. FM]
MYARRAYSTLQGAVDSSACSIHLSPDKKIRPMLVSPLGVCRT